MPKTRLISPGSIPNHKLLKNLQLQDNYISNDGGDEGIRVADNGDIALTSSGVTSNSLTLTNSTLTTGGLCSFISNDSLNDSATKKLLFIDYNKSGVTPSTRLSSTTALGIGMSDSATNNAAGNVVMQGIDMELSASSDQGNIYHTGIVLKLAADGVGDAANITGLAITAKNGSKDILLRDHTDVNNYFSISAGADGATTIETVDGGGAAANLTLTIDGTIGLDAEEGVLIDYDHSRTSTGTETALDLDFQANAVVADGATLTNYGIDLDLTTVGPTMHSGSTVNSYGIDINVVGTGDGTSTNTGMNIAVSGADTNYALITAGGNVGIDIITPPNTFSASPVQYSTGTASQSGTTVTGSGTTWTAAMIGSQFVYADGTSSGAITARASNTSITVTTSQTVSSQAYKIHYQGLHVKSDGKVGIGTATPTTTLEVKGADPQLKLSGGISANLSISFDEEASGSTNAEIKYHATGTSPTDNRLGFYTYGPSSLTEKFTILKNGGIGIGGLNADNSVDPAILHIQDGAFGEKTYITINNTSLDQFLKIGVNDCVAEIGWDNNDDLQLGIWDTYNDTSLTPYVTVKNAGNVGIRVTDPDQALEVNGDIHVENTVYFTAETANTIGNAATGTIDWNTSQKQKVTITGTHITCNFTNPAGPCNLLLKVVQGDGSDLIATWDGDIKWPANGIAPTLSTGNGDIDIISFYFDGTNYFGVASLDFATP